MTHASSQAIQVAGICGSLRKGSFTRMALHVALAGAKEAGAQTRLLDLSEYHLIFCDGKEDESGYPKDVFTLREDVRAAQGIILATPEYHGGYSGGIRRIRGQDAGVGGRLRRWDGSVWRDEQFACRWSSAARVGDPRTSVDSRSVQGIR